MPQYFENAARLLPSWLRGEALRLPESARSRAEELRLRMGRAPTVLLPEGERAFSSGPVGEREIAAVLENASRSSLHSVKEELRRGYISTRGGVRVGVCGTAVMGGGVEMLREISSLAIRMPRQIRDAGGKTADALSGGKESVLILSPPGGGKTTFLRELIRRASEKGVRVSLADERCEVAAAYMGCPQFDLGPCTDVMSGAPKAAAAMMLLRSMNPMVIAMDEISAAEDAAAIESAANCGVKIYATAHARSIAELEKRPVYRRVLECGAFDKAVMISGRGERSYAVSDI